MCKAAAEQYRPSTLKFAGSWQSCNSPLQTQRHSASVTGAGTTAAAVACRPLTLGTLAGCQSPRCPVSLACSATAGLLPRVKPAVKKQAHDSSKQEVEAAANASGCAMCKCAGCHTPLDVQRVDVDGIAQGAQTINHLDGEVVGGVLCLHTPCRHHQLAIGPSIVQHHFIALTA